LTSFEGYFSYDIFLMNFDLLNQTYELYPYGFQLMIEVGYLMSEVILSIREEEELFVEEFLYLESLVILLTISKKKADLNEAITYKSIKTTDVF